MAGFIADETTGGSGSSLVTLLDLVLQLADLIPAQAGDVDAWALLRS